MNIFVLDKNPKLSAKYHNDKHVVKMLTEYAQLLNNTYYITNEFDKVGVKKDGEKYSPTHLGHPSAKWVNENLSNWFWLYESGIELYKEYKTRYGKDRIHYGGETVLNLKLPNLEDFGFKGFAVGFNSEIQQKYEEYENDIVGMYRQYYMNEKRHIATWKTETPEWFI